jgi:two-component system response regulator YesN
LDFSQLVLNICRCYQEQHFLNYLRAVQPLEEAWLKTNLREHRQTVQALADFFNCAINCPLRPDQDFKAWVETLQQHGEQRLRQATRDEAQMAHLIDQAIALVDENYMRNIGIGQIAERLNITPNYLSTLFHKKTGVNFMSYVKKVRLLKAQALLSDPDVQIQRVAEQVGYFSARHFSRLFAEQFGCLPSEYRDRFKNR